MVLLGIVSSASWPAHLWDTHCLLNKFPRCHVVLPPSADRQRRPTASQAVHVLSLQLNQLLTGAAVLEQGRNYNEMKEDLDLQLKIGHIVSKFSPFEGVEELMALDKLTASP